MEDFMKIVKSLEEYGLLIKGVSKTIRNEAKEQNGRFISMLLGTLGASLSGNLSTGKRVQPKIPRREVIRACEEATATSQGGGTVTVGQDF